MYRLTTITCISICLLIFGSRLTAQPVTSAADTPLNFLMLVREAEAKSTAKQWPEAIQLWEQVVKANPVQVRNWRAYANTAYQAKQYRKAIDAYVKVIELGGGFPSAAAYNIACCYALLGEKEPALQWLQKAFDMGFRNLSDAQTDTDLQSLRDDSRYQKLVGLTDVTRLSRDEGWRVDLNLFAREFKRRGFLVPRKITPAEFDAAVKQLNEAIPKLTDMQIAIEFARLAARTGDGHTNIFPGPQSAPAFHPALPLKFYLFKEGLYIIAADPRLKDLLGAEVLRFGDHNIAEVVAALTPLVSLDQSPIWIKERAPYMMRSLPLLNGLGLIPKATEVALTIRDLQGQTRTVTLAADLTEPEIWNTQPNPAKWINLSQTLSTPPPLYLQKPNVPYWFEYLPEQRTVYFQFNSVRNDEREPLAKFSERLFQFINEHDVDKLVIDMRWNNGGNTFLLAPLLKGLISNAKINQDGKLFIIIGRRVFSAAQNAVGYFERQTNATFVGEPTGSTPNFVGDEVFFTLPYSKLLANVSDIYWQSGTIYDFRTWLAPQIYVEPTFAAYRANRDLAMETILALPKQVDEQQLAAKLATHPYSCVIRKQRANLPSD